ncbi:metal-dependent transcriptional regulator [Inconstantimicrobium mannanitabidum]|uniref:Fur family transcriptional regulator n=1 Tax=Inconstantimicrobium mannanitabidum TaxID=1604901 RepID=A0ACB5RAW3_9CLOT|nr:iron dependent repressor, metal binding and dimerization domain protein [Clostridium sp. TW13]GKX66182.1 Fur family transcriptional regulator [Clostridium sp. TW13]
MDNSSFYTFNEYMKNEEDSLTASMQDYLEMIYRLSLNKGFTRVHDLSKSLNVQPPSATKMIQKLSDLKLLKYEKYGIIILEKEGEVIGEALLNRHNIIEHLLKILGIPEEEILKETEKIEHTISKKTTICFQNFIDFIHTNPDILEQYKDYVKNQK